jgi:4'-phosphopantetheinyl transferase
MVKDKLNLWCAYPDDLSDEQAAKDAVRLLSEEELARWRRFKFDRHGREYLATHALARTVLSEYRDCPPESWRFQLNAHGKPSIDPECGLRFNLSNSLGLVVCLVSEGAEVGVDVEPCARAESIIEVAQRMFSPVEFSQLEALREDHRPERALHLWTLKEAYIKARGMGLALPLNKFSFVFAGEKEVQLEIDPSLGDEPRRWRFCLLEHAGHCIALMVESEVTPVLRCLEARLPYGAHRRLDMAQIRWFPSP